MKHKRAVPAAFILNHIIALKARFILQEKIRQKHVYIHWPADQTRALFVRSRVGHPVYNYSRTKQHDVYDVNMSDLCTASAPQLLFLESLTRGVVRTIRSEL